MGSGMNDAIELEYVGFWPRVWASAVDSAILILIVVPLIAAMYGWGYFTSDTRISGPVDFLVSWVLPAIAVMVFWLTRNTTPGKMTISALILDEKTGMPPSLGQYIGRYASYYLSAIPLGLGFVWVAFDSKKQGWHDKLAGTVVVRVRKKPIPLALRIRHMFHRRSDGLTTERQT